MIVDYIYFYIAERKSQDVRMNSIGEKWANKWVYR